MTADGKTVLCEVGVGPMGMAFSALVWQDPRIEILAFEPLPRYYEEVLAAAAGRPNVKLYNVAIGDEDGTTILYDEGTSSSLAGVSSPSMQHKGELVERAGYTVDVKRISHYDHGQIDLLRVDIEGNEWFALKHLVSRPRQIVIEMYNNLATYINPYLYEITEWARREGYRLVSVRDSDFVYER